MKRFGEKFESRFCFIKMQTGDGSPQSERMVLPDCGLPTADASNVCSLEEHDSAAFYISQLIPIDGNNPIELELEIVLSQAL